MSELENLYQRVIIEQARERHGFGLGESAAADSHQLNPTCGDEITLQLHLSDDGNTVEDVTWEGQGCSISMASASLLHDLVEELNEEGEPLTLDQARERIAEFRDIMRSRGQKTIDPDRFGDAVALEGVSKFIARVKCAMLAWVALEDTLVKVQVGEQA